MEAIIVLRMKVFYNPIFGAMVYLNYNNLDGETQERLLKQSRKEIEEKHGKELHMYAINCQKDYDAVLEEEAIRNLYSYKFIFTI